MKLFSKEVNLKLFKQYPKGGDLQNQVVVTKIFNPYGAGRWYLINSDPDDPDYIWAIVQMGSTVEVGSVSRNQLESIRIKPFNLPLERDLYFDPVNAAELFKGLSEGKFYKAGGWTEGSENKAMLLNQAEGFEHHAEELEKAVKASDHIPAWVVAKSERASTDLSDITHYLDGENEQKREMVEGEEEEEEYADGGEVKWQEAEYGDNALVVSENKMGVILKPYGRKFHLKFVDGTEKTYDASELKFFKDMDDFDMGGDVKSRYKIIVYHGGEGKDEVVYADSISEAREKAGKGEHAEIYDTVEKKEIMAEGGDIKKQEWVAVYVNQEKPSERKIIQAFGNTKEEATRNARMSEGYHGIKKPFELTEIYTYSGNLPMMAEGGGIKISDKSQDRVYKVSYRIPAGAGYSREIKAQNPNEAKKIFRSQFAGTGFKIERVKLSKTKNDDTMAEGGKVKFADKVASVKASLLKRKKVPKAVQKDYGKTFSPAEAEDSAKRIVGAMTAKERLQARIKKSKK